MSASPLRVVLRADADASMGTGHVMRSLALAQAVRDEGGTATFATASVPAPLERRLRAEGFEVARLASSPGSASDAAETVALARAVGSAWTVVDGYHLGADFRKEVRAGAGRLLAIDDEGLERAEADAVLNQNVHAREELYARCDPGTTLLLGTRYALLRREFLERSGEGRSPSRAATRVLVTLGGGDAANVTLGAVRGLERLGGSLEVRVLIGSANPNEAALAAAIASSRSPHVVKLERDANVPECMAWADVAVAAAGSTCWELLFMGLPSLLLVVAENQREVARALDESGAARALAAAPGEVAAALAPALAPLIEDGEARWRMTRAGRELVDGRGARRVVSALRSCGESGEARARMVLRRASAEDCRIVFEWSNDPETRARSFSQEPIAWGEHVRWFEEKLSDPGHVFLIAELEGSPVGQVRFATREREAVVSVSVAPAFRGRGHAATLIELGSKAAFAALPIDRIFADVKPDNVASSRAFARSGYRADGEAPGGDGARSVRLVLERASARRSDGRG